jgi:aminoglycoside phosphotransferase family enzyme/predicted kinase
MKAQHIPEAQTVLIDSLAALLGSEGREVQRFETHISWVLVSGGLAYKFKKALKFDFLDFSTLEARHRSCQDELRLNRRYAPGLYLGLLRVAGSPTQPVIDGAGAPIEYGVTMRAFPQQALWTHRLESGSLTVAEIDGLAHLIARFHAAAPVAPADSAWGTPEALRKAAADNLDELAVLAGDAGSVEALRECKAWQERQHGRLARSFAERRNDGFIRECHADLHCGNILSERGEVSVFDCIEFNESLRWIDVMDDVAFICMDLACRGRQDLGARLLNQYLEATGDYPGLGVFRYYWVQRALVRSKVMLLRDQQSPRSASDAGQALREPARYLQLALAATRQQPVALIIMHGLSGSGKSTLASRLVAALGAVRIRSDVERKRLLGLSPLARAAAAPDSGAYDPGTTRRTYARLHRLARHILDAGLSVIVDAAFLKRAQRQYFEHLANRLGIPFFIVDMQDDAGTLRQRILGRDGSAQDPSDAGLDTLAHQLATQEALCRDEQKYVIDASSAGQIGLAPLFDASGKSAYSFLPAARPPD